MCEVPRPRCGPGLEYIAFAILQQSLSWEHFCSTFFQLAAIPELHQSPAQTVQTSQPCAPDPAYMKLGYRYLRFSMFYRHVQNELSNTPLDINAPPEPGRSHAVIPR
jgi:hypothetical protein